MMTYGGVEVQLHMFKTQALDWPTSSASRSGLFIPVNDLPIQIYFTGI